MTILRIFGVCRAPFVDELVAKQHTSDFPTPAPVSQLQECELNPMTPLRFHFARHVTATNTSTANESGGGRRIST
jgi:hypothetical protein